MTMADNNTAPLPAPEPEPVAINPSTFALAAAAGLAAAIAGAALWAVVTVLTEYQIGFMAVAVGFLVGRAIIFVAKHGSPAHGILGAVLSLFGCLLGNLLSAIGFAAPALGMSYFELLASLDFDLMSRLMSATFNVMDLLFYGIGIYEGFRFASRR